VTARSSATGREHAAMLGRFLFVGGAFSLTYAALSALLVSAGAPPFWSALGLYSVAIPLAYLAQKSFTFRVKTPRRGAFLVYLATQLGSFALIASVTVHFVAYHIIFDFMLYAMTAACAAVLSFAVNKTVGVGVAR
jgi:putative flippase GtrA